MAAEMYLLSSLVLILSVSYGHGGEFCDSSWSTRQNTKYCEYGCCGNYYDQYCCSYNLVGIIVGSIIGGIALISFIIAVVCCCIKKSSHSGQVVQPAHQNTMVVYTAHGYPAGPNQGQYGYPNPPAYSDPRYPPPGSSAPASVTYADPPPKY